MILWFNIFQVLSTSWCLCALCMQKVACSISDLTPVDVLGQGTCGHVVKMRHRASGYTMAVKVNYKNIAKFLVSCLAMKNYIKTILTFYVHICIANASNGKSWWEQAHYYGFRRRYQVSQLRIYRSMHWHFCNACKYHWCVSNVDPNLYCKRNNLDRASALTL